jgi:uncharacterized protein
VKISYDPVKRLAIFQDRGLDFEDVPKILAGLTFTQSDDRRPYPEVRFITYGLLDQRLVMFAWTPTEDGIRVISMRKCNDREQIKFSDRLGR